MFTQGQLKRLSADQIAYYASFLNFESSDVNYLYNLQAPGQNYDDHCAISAEIGRQRRVAAIEALDPTPEIKKYLFDNVSRRGMQPPVLEDFTSFFQRALDAKNNAHGRPLPAYKPEPVNGKIKMVPAKAVRYLYSQESYADHNEIAIPFEGEGDLKAFERNVHQLVRRANTHTGWAGSGSTYEVTVKDKFVVLFCRASIAD